LTTPKQIASAMKRVESVLERRPRNGLAADAPASACWEGGLRVVTRHDGGARISTDMPEELAGSGDQFTPGWLLRAGLASCLATRIAMAAAAEGLDLDAIEVVASSHSDARGLLGVAAAGEPANPGPLDVKLHVRISAPGISAQRLHTLVEYAQAHSPVSAALIRPVPISLSVEAI
jgi:uncharacterized OsmC-like protein